MRVAGVFSINLNKQQCCYSEEKRETLDNIAEEAYRLGYELVPKKSRVVVAEIFDVETKEFLAIGKATLNPTDHFNWKIGRQIAIDDALKSYAKRNGIQAGMYITKKIYFDHLGHISSNWDIWVVANGSKGQYLSDMENKHEFLIGTRFEWCRGLD
jgi:hypothetical protein